MRNGAVTLGSASEQAEDRDLVVKNIPLGARTGTTNQSASRRT